MISAKISGNPLQLFLPLKIQKRQPDTSAMIKNPCTVIRPLFSGHTAGNTVDLHVAYLIDCTKPFIVSINLPAQKLDLLNELQFSSADSINMLNLLLRDHIFRS